MILVSTTADLFNLSPSFQSVGTRDVVILHPFKSDDSEFWLCDPLVAEFQWSIFLTAKSLCDLGTRQHKCVPYIDMIDVQYIHYKWL